MQKTFVPRLRRVEVRGRTGTPTRQEEVRTFDVFETVLVRMISPPAAVFDVVGRRAASVGLLDCSPAAFGRARQWAEARALRWTGDRTSLEGIYAEMCHALRLEPEVGQRLAELELEVERSLLRTWPAARRMVDAERASSGRVVYVSDMYLPARFIEDQLRTHGLFTDGDALFVSHAHGATKRTGMLFPAVADALGVRTSDLVHHGNDVRNDVRGPARAGARGIGLTDGNPTRYEQTLEQHRRVTDGVTSVMAGSARLARLHAAPADARQRALVDVAAGAMSPLLTAYVEWLLAQAERRGLQRLYFVARDGQVLLRIAQRLVDRRGRGPELRYLYASRLVWNRVVASPSRHPQAWHSLVGLSSDGVSGIELLRRIGLEEQEVQALVGRSGGDHDKWSSTTQRTELFKIFSEVDADGTLARAAERNKQDVVEYLEQVGLFDDVPHGFVDVGWRGTQHDVLLELQSERRSTLAHGLFLGLEESLSQWRHHREAFLLDSRLAPRPADRDAVRGLSPHAGPAGVALPHTYFTLIEIFCSGDHGTLVDYARRPDGAVEPVFGAAREKLTAEWGLPLLWDTLDSYLDAYLDADECGLLDSRHVDVLDPLVAVLRQFWDRPTRDEVRAWSTFPWEVGQGAANRTVPLAAPFRVWATARAVANEFPSTAGARLVLARRRKAEWLPASLRLSTVPARLVHRPRATLLDLAGRGVRSARRRLYSMAVALRTRLAEERNRARLVDRSGGPVDATSAATTGAGGVRAE
ncbi:hypothetical protein [Aquipuribacter nitratireducens]|uniref:HAD family hydrolase n=1 Tax=Aquipuribacter nitratireducens TaxID=650104 RepID=A0ABW0GPG8_9MICO